MRFSQKFKTNINGTVCYGVAFYTDYKGSAQSSAEKPAGPFDSPSNDIQIYSIMCTVADVVMPVFYKSVIRQGVEVLPDDFSHPDIDKILSVEEERLAAWRSQHPKEVVWMDQIGLNAKARHTHDIVRTIYHSYLEDILQIEDAYKMIVDLFKMNTQGLVWRAKSISEGNHAHKGDMVYGYLYIFESPIEQDRYGAPRYFIGFHGNDGVTREYEIDASTLEIVFGAGTPEHRMFKDKLAELELKPFLDSLECPKEL